VKLRLGRPVLKFYYVYILEATNYPDRYYIGFTEDLSSRLNKHNTGQVQHTSKFRPWKVKNAFAFSEDDKARSFERYLKTGSGRAFAKKHF
jgi:putative endonuclease